MLREDTNISQIRALSAQPEEVGVIGRTSGGKRKFTFFCYLSFLFVCLFIESGKEGERKGERHQCAVASRVRPTGDLAGNPGMWPDWE